MLKVLLPILVALIFVGSAQAHQPFNNGRATALHFQRVYRKINPLAHCVYANPHILCLMKTKTIFSEEIDQVTIHKTGSRRGYARFCVFNNGSLTRCVNQQVRW